MDQERGLAKARRCGEGAELERSELEKVRGERLEKSKELEEARGERLECEEAKVSESSVQSGDSMKAKHRGAGV